jgi:hypothetical protein
MVPAFVPSALLLWAFGFESAALLTAALVVPLAVVVLARLSREIPVYVVPTNIELDGSGVTLDMGKVVRRWPWYTITDIHEGEQLLCIVYMHGRHWLLIPRSSFADSSECTSFVAEAHQLRARWGHVPSVDDRALDPRNLKISWDITVFYWVFAAGFGLAAWNVASLALRVVLGAIAIAMFVIGWPEAKFQKPEHVADTTVRISRSPFGQMWIGVWMLAALLLASAAAAESTLRLVLSGLGILASWWASGLIIELLSRLMHRGPQIHVQELRIEDKHFVIETLDGRISTSWEQLAPAKIQAQHIELGWPGSEIFVEIPRSAFVSDAHWSSFIDALASVQPRLTS